VADLLYVGMTLAFFALCGGYVAWCDRMVGPDPVEHADTTEGARQ